MEWLALDLARIECDAVGRRSGGRGRHRTDVWSTRAESGEARRLLGAAARRQARLRGLVELQHLRLRLRLRLGLKLSLHDGGSPIERV